MSTETIIAVAVMAVVFVIASWLLGIDAFTIRLAVTGASRRGKGAMKAIMLQIIVFLCAVAAIAGIKTMAFPAWITYPLVAVVLLLAITGLAAAHGDRKSA